MRRGFTLIELVISSAIFASVLMMAFTAVAAVNRLQRQVQSQRLFYGTSQTVWQTISHLARYAQRPAASLSGCSSSELGAPSTILTEAVTVQDSGRRLWLVAPNMAAGSSYRVFLFALTDVDAQNRYQLSSVRFTASPSACTADTTAVDLFGGTGLRARVAPGDPTPFTRSTAGAGVVTGVPNANALATTDAFGLPWRLKINLTVVRTDSSTNSLPIFGTVTSRTPQGVISQ